MPQPLVHLLCGSTGAGKTRYAHALAAEIGAIHFSIDRWMSALFWMDAPIPIRPDWALARIERCLELIWPTAIGIARCDMPVILEIGLTTVARRADAIGRLAAAGLSYRLVFLDVAADERWRRVEAREASGGRELPFPIDRAMFDYVESVWEPPTAGELAACDGIRIG